MRKRPPRDLVARWFLGSLALIVCPSCGAKPAPNPQAYVPEAQQARRALEWALEAWHKSPDLERTVSSIRPVMFVDQQRLPGQRLLGFKVIEEVPEVQAYRRYLVRLSLEGVEEPTGVSYYVFGQGPIWVYRAEDLDMLLHMDHSMMAASASAAESAVLRDDSGAGAVPEHHHRPPTSKPSETGTALTPAPP